jgi:thioredoxin-dependent adenylylsulfate APS reductase
LIAAPETASGAELLNWAISSFGSSFAIVTSFQKEGMVLIDMAAKISRDVRVLTLDTGRLPEATYQMMEAVRSRYGVTVEVVLPDRSEVEQMVGRFGPNLFFQEVSLRRLCCEVRKVRPLERKLRELRAWATGLRREQSEIRGDVPLFEQTDGRLKLNPLVDWSADQVEEYTLQNDVPRHPLYAGGYTSIGCEPCTRATRPGEHERAGRWWWEEDAHKECGLHFTPDGKAERTLDVLLREITTSKAHGS